MIAEPLSLVSIGNATRMLAEAKSLDDVRTIRDLAEAARVYARAHDLGIEAMNHAAEIKLRAERRAGELLTESRETGQRLGVGRPEKTYPADTFSDGPQAAPATLSDLGISRVQSSRWQAIASLPEPEFEAAIADTKDQRAPLTTAGMVRLAGMMSSDSPEWYSPREIVDAASLALGGIDLDPCSNPGEPNVPARRHLTAADDGLAQGWRGTVYMNPPYGRGIGEWIGKLASEHAYGNVPAAVALLPARTDTAWWRALPARRVCFVSGRLRFSGADAAPFPSAAAYLGPDPQRFADAFAPLGLVYDRRDAS